jgi:hypothetical protein
MDQLVKRMWEGRGAIYRAPVPFISFEGKQAVPTIESMLRVPGSDNGSEFGCYLFRI